MKFCLFFQNQPLVPGSDPMASLASVAGGNQPPTSTSVFPGTTATPSEEVGKSSKKKRKQRPSAGTPSKSGEAGDDSASSGRKQPPKKKKKKDPSEQRFVETNVLIFSLFFCERYRKMN